MKIAEITENASARKSERVIMDETAIRRTLVRLSHEIEEENEGLDGVVLVGIRRGGEVIARRIANILKEAEGVEVPATGIDISMRRDDLVSEFFVPVCEDARLPFSVEKKIVVICDDVLHTGRSVRAAVEAIFRLGRPKAVRLLELTDRGGRQLPIRADYVGKNVPAAKDEYLEVYFTELGCTEDKITVRKEDKV